MRFCVQGCVSRAPLGLIHLRFGRWTGFLGIHLNTTTRARTYARTHLILAATGCECCYC